MCYGNQNCIIRVSEWPLQCSKVTHKFLLITWSVLKCLTLVNSTMPSSTVMSNGYLIQSTLQRLWYLTAIKRLQNIRLDIEVLQSFRSFEELWTQLQLQLFYYTVNSVWKMRNFMFSSVFHWPSSFTPGIVSMVISFFFGFISFSVYSRQEDWNWVLEKCLLKSVEFIGCYARRRQARNSE